MQNEAPPLISVITSTYNCAHLLERMFDNICLQTSTNFEHIIVDGASTDGTVDIIKSYAANKKRVTWISAEDSGIYEAWNRGLALVSGEWVVFLSADDCFKDPQVLKFMEVELLSADIDIGLVYGVLERVNEKGQVVVRRHASQPEKHMGTITGRRPWTPPQRAIFHNKKIFSDYTFDESYKICADDKLLLLVMKKWGLQFVPITICQAKFGGVSDGAGMQNYLEVIKMCQETAIFLPWKIRISFFLRSLLKTVFSKFFSDKLFIKLISKYRQKKWKTIQHTN